MVAYANDAMEGLDLANQLMDEERRAALRKNLEAETRKLLASAAKPAAPAPMAGRRASSVRQDVEIPLPPDLKPHVVRGYDLAEVFRYINPVMLYTRHLGLRNYEAALASGDARAKELTAAVAEVEEVMLGRADIAANAIYRFFPARSDGDRTIMIYSSDGKTVLESLIFGRQSDEPGLSLADYVAPRSSGKTDYLCMFVTTIGAGVRALADEWKDRGEYLRSHILQILALEGAEAFAELLHQKIRQMWGFGDPPGITMKELHQAHYHGKRFSFGYPACPRLEDQEKLFRLLEVDKHGIGLQLTEGFMMDPESAVSAMVFHHPEARYFSLSAADIEALERELSPAPADSPLALASR
jgi:5-methyltetrahydrofolate--homocysteine methyltransferase